MSVGTTAKWALTTLDEPFDILFVDEAWQMARAEFMLCGLVSGRFVLIGDPDPPDRDRARPSLGDLTASAAPCRPAAPPR